MTAVVGGVEAVVNGIAAIRKIAEDLKGVIGDHALVAQLEQVVTDVENAVHDLGSAPTTVERVAEEVWQKITAGFDGLFHPHQEAISQAVKQSATTVAAAVDKHTEAVATAVTDAVATGQPVATGPQPPAADRPVGSAATAGAPAGSQGGNAGAVASNAVEDPNAQAQADLPITGQTIDATGQAVDVHDGGKAGASAAIQIS